MIHHDIEPAADRTSCYVGRTPISSLKEDDLDPEVETPKGAFNQLLSCARWRREPLPTAARRCFPGKLSLAAAMLTVLLVGGAAWHAPPGDPDPVPLRVSGLIGNSSGDVYPVSPKEAEGAAYLPESNVLRLPDGRLRYVPEGAEGPVSVKPGSPGAAASAAETRAWLESGEVPGTSPLEKEISTRSLLDLRLLTGPNGATLAAPNDRWDFVWPRDASWVAAAFAATGHHEESYEVLEFLARAQGEDGTWEARYHADGEPVLDGRGAQLDAAGWFTWAVWFYAATGGEGAEDLWPAARRASDAAARSLGADGLPPGGADYWEISTLRPNLGTAAPLRTGLRSAAALGDELGHEEDAARYRAAASRLQTAIERDFAPNEYTPNGYTPNGYTPNGYAPNGYARTTWPMSGRDAAVTFLAPPFAPFDPALDAEVRKTEAALTASNGGIVPGERWPWEPTVAWTPETAFFMLSASAGGDEERADYRFRWLAAHRTSLGALAEKVDADGSPKAAAPLAWTEAIIVLALAAEDEGLPVPPAQ